MRKTMLLGAALLAVAGMLTVVNVTRGQCGGGASCWQTKDCDEWQHDPGCATYEQTDMTDLKWLASTGYDYLNAGDVDRRTWVHSNGSDEIDTNDLDCDGNKTEHICHGGGTVPPVQYPGGTVTWYAGYGTCP
jgi:hypothetical protein